MTSSQDSAHVSCMLLGEDVLHVKQDSMALLAARSLDVQGATVMWVEHMINTVMLYQASADAGQMSLQETAPDLHHSISTQRCFISRQN